VIAQVERYNIFIQIDWYDTDREIRVDHHHSLVKINKRCRLCNINDVFIFLFKTMLASVLYVHLFL
jgi:hypothetical protein